MFKNNDLIGNNEIMMNIKVIIMTAIFWVTLFGTQVHASVTRQQATPTTQTSTKFFNSPWVVWGLVATLPLTLHLYLCALRANKKIPTRDKHYLNATSEDLDIYFPAEYGNEQGNRIRVAQKLPLFASLFWLSVALNIGRAIAGSRK